MRRTLLLLAVPLILSACGSRSSSSSASCTSRYWDGAIGTCLPQGWHVVDQDVMKERGMPEAAVAAFQADQATSGVFPSVVVMREVLRKDIDSVAYSKASIDSVKSLNGYQQVDLKDVSIEGETVQIHTYIAQPNAEQPKQRYYQVAAVSGRNGFAFTAGLPLSVDKTLEAKVLLILENVAFHNVESEK